MGEYEVRALREVDLTIDEGEFVAIMGPSGSGKSTLMYLLGCLDTPTAGSYRLGGVELSKLDDARLSRVRNRQIGFIFQQFFLLPDLNITENVALGLTYAGQARASRQAIARDLADRVGLTDWLSHRPRELSGGQMQRVAIARALASGPDILLADEPTGNLDSRTSREIMQLFHDLNAEGRTVILVTHDPNVSGQARRVISLLDGEVVSDERRSTGIEHAADPTPGASAEPSGSRDGASGGHGRAVSTVAPDTPHHQAPLARLRLADLVAMSLREGLLVHKLRSMLTMLGIIFGIAAVISMNAITEGGKDQQLEQLRQIGMNNIQVRDLELKAARLLRERRVNPRGVTLQDLEHLLRHVPGIAAAAAWKSVLAELSFGDRTIEDANTLGVYGDFESVVNYHVAAGRFIDDDDEKGARRVCVVGPRIADELTQGEDPLGKVFIIGDQPFVVVGVMEQKAFTASDIADVSITNRNRDVYVPYKVMRLYFRKDSKDSELDVISLRMDSDEQLIDESDLIRYIMEDLHLGADDFGVYVPLEKLKQAQETKRVFNVITVVIAGISLIVGGIGIMNIMLATVTERTREIGIRRAIGAARRNVLGQFLTESLLIALFGGMLGIVAGVLGGLIVQQFIGFRVAFSPFIMALAAIVSMAVGIAFGIYPAYLAAHKDPVEALRN